MSEVSQIQKRYIDTVSTMRIYRSRDPDVDIPSNLNLTELLHSSARSPLPSDHVIAQDDLEERTLTLGQLRSTAGRLAAGLTKEFQPRDQSRWAVILPNSVAIVEAVHTVLWLGGAFCPINHQLKAGEIAHAVTVSRPEFIIVYTEVLQKVVEGIELARQKCPDLKVPRVVTAIGPPVKGYPNLYADFMAAEPLQLPHYQDTKQRLASIHLSSGTTGNPKGVGLSHYNYIANVLQMWAHDPDHWSPEVRVVSFTPFVHIAATTVPFFVGPWTGMVHIIMATFEIEAYARLIEKTKATGAQISPGSALVIGTSDLADRHDLSSVKHMFCGPLPLKQEDYLKFLQRGPWKTVTLYGMTEAAPYVAWQKVVDTLPLGKSGTIMPNIQASLRLENGQDAPEGGPGELWLKGPNMTSGYVDNPAANQAAFDKDGWYNTGDVCTISSEGHLQVVGRTKELIKYNGFQVSPMELEAYIVSHPAVADAAIGGVWDSEKMTELPTAYVVLRDHLTGQAEKIEALKDIQKVVDSQVSGYKKLRGGTWEVSLIPKNATMKVLRKELALHRTGLCSIEVGNRASKL